MTEDAPKPSAGPAAADAAISPEARRWAMFLHFSMLAGSRVPLAGLLAPIIIWRVKRGQIPWLDVHGKIVVNWILSALIYAVVSIWLIYFGVGILLLIALGLVSVLYAIVGGIKANNGHVWKYPGSISFLK